MKCQLCGATLARYQHAEGACDPCLYSNSWLPGKFGTDTPDLPLRLDDVVEITAILREAAHAVV